MIIKSNNLLFGSLSIFIITLLLSVWGAGLLRFVGHVGIYAQPSALEAYPVVDAIIVLTGGSERVETGLALMAAKRGKKLLISGVYPGVKTKQILGASLLPTDVLKCCVTLGHAAEDTRGNAQEAFDFMRAENFHSMQLVTSHYHMPRSLLLFRTLMPEIKIIPHPVLPDAVDLSLWWKRPGTRSLLIAEYHKYLIVQLGLFLESF